MPTFSIPIPRSLQARSSPYDLKERLEWGEPALTIVDMRSREIFNQQHIMGATTAPMHVLVSTPSSVLARQSIKGSVEGTLQAEYSHRASQNDWLSPT